MKKEDVMKILPGVLAGNGDDAKLLTWCKEHLPAVLKSAGIHKWVPPYYGMVSEYSEDYKHTWESGQSATLTQAYMDVFESNNDVFIGRVPISSFKSTVAICELIKRDSHWYLLTADSRIKIYSLPGLSLVAESEENHGKIFDIWCPRLHCELDIYNLSDGKERAFYHCVVDDDIEEGQDWESVLFAFVDSYDPYCYGPDYVHMLDLRHFTNGTIKSQFLTEKPNYLNLRNSINVSDWTKEWPVIDIAKHECISTVDNTSPQPNGWVDSQLDYFNWSGEEEDCRTSRQLGKKESIEWLNHPDCVFLSKKLGVDYDHSFYNHVDSKEEAVLLAKENPERLKLIVLHNFRNGAIYNSALAVHGLMHVEPDDDIRDALRYISKNSRHQELRKAAKEALINAYPEDVLVKRFTRLVKGATQ